MQRSLQWRGGGGGIFNGLKIAKRIGENDALKKRQQSSGSAVDGY